MAGQKHPGTSMANRYYAIGGLIFLLGVLASALGVPIGGVFVLLAGVFIWLGRFLGKTVVGAEAINQAQDRVARGELREAEALLAAIPSSSQVGHLRRAIGILRAHIAFQTGDSAAAERHATAAIAGRHYLLTRAYERIQLPSAHAIRALARAVSDQDHDATEDITAVRASPDALADALARASLAEMVRAARIDDRETIRRVWTADKRLMLEQLRPRERVLARTLSRLATEKKSVYREPARVGEDVDPIRSWAARLVPQAAIHVDDGRQTRSTDAAVPHAAAVGTVAASRATAAKSARSQFLRRMALALLPLGLLFGLLTSGVLVSDATPGGPLFLLALPPIFIVGALALAWRAVREGKRATALLRKVSIASLRGDVDVDVTSDLETLSKSRYSLLAAQAESIRSDVAERAGRFVDAIASAERAIGLSTVTAAARTVSHDTVLPLAIAQRAFGLAALGRIDEAEAELANLTAFEKYANLARATFRVRLAIALAKGDRRSALELARGRTMDLPLPLRDEILCDLLEANEGSGVDRDEWEQLESELRGDPQLAAWVEHFLPGARARLAPRTRVVSTDEVEVDAIDAEAQHLDR